jgi:hypothetical protein
MNFPWWPQVAEHMGCECGEVIKTLAALNMIYESMNQEIQLRAAEARVQIREVNTESGAGKKSTRQRQSSSFCASTSFCVPHQITRIAEFQLRTTPPIFIKFLLNFNHIFTIY